MVSKVGPSNLTKGKSDTVGFIIACLFSSAIDLGELNQWATSVVERMEVDDIPGYIFDLIDFDGALAEIYKTIGFSPVWNRSDEEDTALLGIAIKRGRDVFDMPMSTDSALQCLDNNPHIKEAFNEIFPFASV